jgi:hypothetical protein
MTMFKHVSEKHVMTELRQDGCGRFGEHVYTATSICDFPNHFGFLDFDL